MAGKIEGPPSEIKFTCRAEKLKNGSVDKLRKIINSQLPWKQSSKNTNFLKNLMKLWKRNREALEEESPTG
ncbi:hypothetical protein B9Z55_023368 [Caenorhabditis nigoni]|uniref:Uncharacterized protein n=1 Tax=Caenorhabditis nigoni TaxID=1611254 RepID=A0A2G5SPR7_9PELO|nr:hypothetical protein B9Z55_023368 [Caenorhabditis nigoni]